VNEGLAARENEIFQMSPNPAEDSDETDPPDIDALKAVAEA
jgi:hypothetical protein